MAPITRSFDRSTLVFFTTAALACVTKIATTAVVVHLATWTLREGPNLPLAVTASAFELFALVTFVACLGLFLRRVSRQLVLIALVPAAVLGFVGTILSLITLALTFSITKTKAAERNPSGYRIEQQLTALGLAIGAIGVIPQTAFYILVLPRTSNNTTVSSPEDAVRTISPGSRSDKRRSSSFTLTSLSARTSHYRSASAPDSPPHCKSPSSPGSSIKRSMSNSLRPMTSRTRLLFGTSFASRDSRSLYSRADSCTDHTRNNSDFENWDTSAVESPLDDSGLNRRPLETIPGSRPVSPADALDGPFSDDRSPEECPLPESSPTPRYSPTSDNGSPRLAPRAIVRKTSVPDQLHIHPLFRSESPVPPPLKSPNTVITASPYAGQIVSSELVGPRILHSAQSSRPGSPSRMTAGSRAGSVRSLRTMPTSPLPMEPDSRGRSHLAEASFPLRSERRDEVSDDETASR